MSDYDTLIAALRSYWTDADARQARGDTPGCPNGPDEHGNWPCDPKGYFGVWECQVCGFTAAVPASSSVEPSA